MQSSANRSRRWKVSARPAGEVLVACCESTDITVVAHGVGLGDRESADRLLTGLVAAARASVAAEARPGPIPALLHHVLARLLALQAGSTVTGATVVYDDGSSVAAGWLGERDLEVQIDGTPAQLPWVRLRDRAGREARAVTFPASREVRLTSGAAGDAAGHAVIEAQWSAGIANDSESEIENVAAGAPPELTAPRTPSGFFNWLDRMVDHSASAPVTKPHAVSATPVAPAGAVSSAPVAGAASGPAKVTLVTPGHATSVAAVVAPLVAPVAAAAEPAWSELPLRMAVGAEAESVGGSVALPHAFAIPVEPAPPVAAAPARLAIVPPPDELQGAAAMSHDAAMPTPAAAPRAPQFLDESWQERESPATPARPLRLAPLRPQWPAPGDDAPPPVWKRPWAWGVLVLALIAGMGIVNALVPHSGSSGAFALPTFGPHFSLTVNSRPAGAWVAIDGKDTGKLTPVTLDLKAGAHQVTLTLSGKGSASWSVTGARNEHTALDAGMYGAVSIVSADPNVPVMVTLDGLERGYAPVSVEDLLPGTHEVRFRAPGVAPWTEMFDLNVGEKHDVTATPFAMPETGVIEVKATLVGPEGAEPAKGAAIFVDGDAHGVTPSALELPRGPHSIRVVYQGEDAPVQVIDLPGGNRRISEFTFGGETPPARFVQLGAAGPIAPAPPTVISAAISGVADNEVREMWLHVRSPDGSWRRYEMSLLKAPEGIVGVGVYPVTMVGPDGAAVYYVSVLTQEGDEYFTELRHPSGRASATTPKLRGLRRATLKAAPLPTTSTEPSTP